MPEPEIPGGTRPRPLSVGPLGPSHDRTCTRCGTQFAATTLCPICYDFPDEPAPPPPANAAGDARS